MDKPGHPVDLEHLNRYTGGDHAINAEILLLFDAQCRDMLVKLDGLSNGQTEARTWREITHTLKGAARGIGAFALGDSVANAETLTPDTGDARLILERLRQDAAAVRTFIAEFLEKAA